MCQTKSPFSIKRIEVHLRSPQQPSRPNLLPSFLRGRSSSQNAEANPLSKAVAQVMRAVRQEHGLTQAKLAEKAGLHATYLSGVENGQRTPTLTLFGRLRGPSA